MPVVFPPLHEATEEGLIAIGGDLEPETLLESYKNGIFPWPISSSYPLTWFSPDPRGILFCDNLHVSRSLNKFLRKSPYTISFNQDFANIIRCCKEAENRVDQTDTWITNQMLSAYVALANIGYCFSVGAYLDGKLVGGIYGVRIGKYFAGESMFYKATNASKVCLVHLIQYILDQGGTWLDTQMVTPITESMGAIEIPRDDFVKLLNIAIKE